MPSVRCLVLIALLAGVLVPGDVLGQGSKGSSKKKPKLKSGVAGTVTPAGIGEFASENFLVRTDLAPDEAKELLDRLEKMLVLVARYYGKPNSQIIEMNVVQNRDRWPLNSIPAEAMPSIQNDAGITLSMTRALQNELGEKQITSAKSIVWAVPQHGIPQHEAVHAYCHQNFGRTGPTWYAEGMAELGAHWRENDVSLRISDEMMNYLKSSKPKDLLEITAPGQQTGDSWQNYAWRWALCHLLSTSPNYAPRFKPLGMALLNDHRSSFEDVYGSMAKEIEFEYQFFLKHMNQGYRSDLCAWDWKSKFQRQRSPGGLQVKVVANRGWQATRLQIKKGDKISYEATGEWEVGKGEPKVGAQGDETGRGRLEAVIFADYQLSEPLELGPEGEFEAKMDGNLFVRCRDDWCEIADNSGAVSAKFKIVP